MKSIIFYQNANLNDEEVIDQFIVRKNEFERVISEIRRDDMSGSIQHYIFIGQRGCGKSTLLRRLRAEINNDNTLKEKLVAIYLSEEQAGIYRFHDLWDKVGQELRIKGFDMSEINWEEYKNDLTGFANALYHAIQSALKKNGKKLVLLLDNIDRILDNIKINDNHLFRELLINHKDLRIIGGSTRLSEHHWKYDQPFYEFFSIIRLNPLTQDELKELLLFWGDFLKEPSLSVFVKKKPGKLNAVRILSDGMPRTLLNLVELLIHRPEEHGFEYLRFIIDRATPVYQERLSKLSPLQQKVVLEISFFWDAVKVKTLAQVAHIESKTLSALLNQLMDLQIVEKIKGTGKNFMYLLRERFFNFWLIMTQGGPTQKSQAKYLSTFFELWYDSNEKEDVNVTNNLDFLYNDSFYQEYTKKYYLLAIEKGNVSAMFNLAKLYQNSGRKEEAEKYYLLAIEKGNVQAMFNLANLYQNSGRKEEAEKYYLFAIEKGYMHAMLNFSSMLYLDNRNKEIAFQQIIQYNSKQKNNIRAISFQVIVELWNGRTEQLESAGEIISEIVKQKDIDLTISFIRELLIHYQKNLVLQWFHNEHFGQTLKDMVKPLYFVTLRLVNNAESKNELLAMAPEMKDTVDSIFTNITDRQRFYYGMDKKEQ